jgi:MFS family permease
MDAMLPVAWAVCLDIGRKYAGSVSGSMNMAGQLGSFLSSVAFGYIVGGLRDSGWSKPDAYNFPLLPFSILLLISGALFLRVDPNRQLIPEATTETSGLKAA